MSVSWAYIFHAPGSDSKADRMVLDRDGLKSLLVPVPSLEAAGAVAKDLVAEGVVSIEVCGYFGTLGAAAVLNAIECAIPVGSVTFGAESALKLAKAFGIPG